MIHNCFKWVTVVGQPDSCKATYILLNPCVNAPWWNPSFDKLLCLLCVDFTPHPVTCDPSASTSTPPLPAHETSSAPRSIPFCSFVNRHIRIRWQCYLLFWYTSESSASFPVLPAFALCANCQGSQWRVSSVWRPRQSVVLVSRETRWKVVYTLPWRPTPSPQRAVLLSGLFCYAGVLREERENMWMLWERKKNDKRKREGQTKIDTCFFDGQI